MGIKKQSFDTFAEGFAFYYPQVFLLLFVFMHIQKQIRSGMFTKPYETYESFEEGLRRYRRLVISSSAAHHLLDSDIVLTVKPEDYICNLCIESRSEFDKFEKIEKYQDSDEEREHLLDLNASPLLLLDSQNEEGDLSFVDEQ